MVNKFLGIVPLFYSAYQYYNFYNTPGFNPDVSFWVKTGVSICLGLFMLVSSNYNSILNIFKLNTQNKTVPVKMIKDDFKQEFDDLACLLHLRSRVQSINSKEGMDLITKLNTILFSIGKNDV